MTTYTVTMMINVDDPQVLYRRAVGHHEEENGTCDGADLEDIFGTEKDPSISRCLTELYDPGMSHPGTTLLNCDADRMYMLEQAFDDHTRDLTQSHDHAASSVFYPSED